jgi:uncharacterized membrane protein
VEELVAVSFQDRYRAAKAFDLLWQMNDESVIELDDVVIVHRDRYGNLEYDREFTSTLDRRLIQVGAWGSLLGALVPISFSVVTNVVLDPVALCCCALAGALVGVIVGALQAAAEIRWWKEHLCVSRCLVPEVIDGIAPDDSVVVAWINSAGIEMAGPVFRGLGGKVVRTTLPPEDAANLEAVLKG